MESKDLFLMVEAISNEKNITKECVFEALEEALATATKKNNNIDAHVEIDRKTGEFSTFRQWMVIEDGENFVDDDGTEFDPELHIHAKDTNGGVAIEDFVREPMETEAFGRIAAQIVKQVIIQKVREAEREVIVEDYTQRMGEVIMVTVKRIDRGNAYVDMGGVDGMIPKFDLIPNESIRKNDRLRAYIKEVKSSPRSAGAIALITYCAGSSSHKITSTRSPFNSFDTACTREPRIPIQEPIGSIRLSFALTANFARKPGSRLTPIISITPSEISGTSISNNSIIISGAVRLKKI
jgi:hypothetical protein